MKFHTIKFHMKNGERYQMVMEEKQVRELQDMYAGAEDNSLVSLNDNGETIVFRIGGVVSMEINPEFSPRTESKNVL